MQLETGTDADRHAAPPAASRAGCDIWDAVVPRMLERADQLDRPIIDHSPALPTWSCPDPVNPTARLWFTGLDPRSTCTWTGTRVAELAARLPTRRYGGLVIGVDAYDIDSALVLADARLELGCWYRDLAIVRAGEPHSLPPGLPDQPVSDLPLPHRHGARHEHASPTSLRVTSGAALASPPVGSRHGSVMFVDPLFAATTHAQATATQQVIDYARSLGVTRLVVVVGPGEPQLDDTLAREGFDRSVDWWWLRPPIGVGRQRDQEQPLVAPHSWQT